MQSSQVVKLNISEILLFISKNIIWHIYYENVLKILIHDVTYIVIYFKFKPQLFRHFSPARIQNMTWIAGKILRNSDQV